MNLGICNNTGLVHEVMVLRSYLEKAGLQNGATPP